MAKRQSKKQKPAAKAMSDAATLLNIRDQNAIRVITLTNPARRNALSRTMIAMLHEALLACAEASPDIRCVIIAGEGPAFCAGHDLKEIQAARSATDNGRAFFEALMASCSAMMLAIHELPMPVIAAVEGIATAAGCQLVASCDLAIAGNDARFATPGVNIGLFCSTPMVALSRNLSDKHSMEMLLTGELIDAGSAHRFGLVNRVVSAGRALESALVMATLIASKPAATVKTGKAAFYRQREMPVDAAYAYTSGVMVENMLEREAQDGIGAFVAGKARPPSG